MVHRTFDALLTSFDPDIYKQSMFSLFCQISQLSLVNESAFDLHQSYIIFPCQSNYERIPTCQMDEQMKIMPCVLTPSDYVVFQYPSWVFKPWHWHKGGHLVVYLSRQICIPTCSVWLQCCSRCSAPWCWNSVWCMAAKIWMETTWLYMTSLKFQMMVPLFSGEITIYDHKIEVDDVMLLVTGPKFTKFFTSLTLVSLVMNCIMDWLKFC